MQTCGNRHIRRRRVVSDALDEVNEELMSASWEVDFLARVFEEDTGAAGETRQSIKA